MDNKKIASQLLFMAREVLGMDFPTQDAFDKYMKDHPDANRSNHKVVKNDPSKPETHPMNLMQQRKNEENHELNEDESIHICVLVRSLSWCPCDVRFPADARLWSG